MMMPNASNMIKTKIRPRHVRPRMGSNIVVHDIQLFMLEPFGFRKGVQLPTVQSKRSGEPDLSGLSNCHFLTIFLE
jgi:hypothetical protein